MPAWPDSHATHGHATVTKVELKDRMTGKSPSNKKA
jgi:hypothetical protein